MHSSFKGTCDRVYQFFDTNLDICMPKSSENGTCTSLNGCLGPMNCTNGICNCKSTEYFDSTQLICRQKTLNNSACTLSWTCRQDLGLTCQSGLCQCNSLSEFWHATQKKCISLLSYSGTGCTSNSHCKPGKELICNSNPTANNFGCPTTSTSGMCDCTRIYGDEY